MTDPPLRHEIPPVILEWIEEKAKLGPLDPWQQAVLKAQFPADLIQYRHSLLLGLALEIPTISTSTRRPRLKDRLWSRLQAIRRLYWSLRNR